MNASAWRPRAFLEFRPGGETATFSPSAKPELLADALNGGAGHRSGALIASGDDLVLATELASSVEYDENATRWVRSRPVKRTGGSGGDGVEIGMQYVLQDFDDTRKLGAVLERAGLALSWHKVVPFVGDLLPEPQVTDPDNVMMFGSYTLWRYAERHGLRPGVFRVRPFLHEGPWQAHMLNGPDALVAPLRDLPARLDEPDRAWFLRPVSDGKEVAGKVLPASEIVALAQRVCALAPEDLIGGSLAPDTDMLLAVPARILQEWRVWIVGDVVATWSLYVDGGRVVYRAEIDDDALEFAEALAKANPGYAPAYVMDVCRTEDGLRLLETNCLNAAGFYAADLSRLVAALEGMDASVRLGSGASKPGAQE